MWIPRTEEEIVAAASRPLGIEETASCDAKLQLPGQDRDLAQDVAAMANEGGVLIYGVGEDANKRAKVLKPIKLPGARERVDQIVQTASPSRHMSRSTRSRRPWTIRSATW